MQISLILPVRFSFFAKACLHNIVETCGMPLYGFDLVFLHNKDIPTNTFKTFEDLKNDGFKFRVVECPFDYGENHLQLLDWIVHNDPKLSKWILTLHCDIFWKGYGWLRNLQKFLSNPKYDNYIAFTSRNSRFRWNKEIIHLTDAVGVFNKNELINKKLSFNWGYVFKGMHLSDEVLQAFSEIMVYEYDDDGEHLVPLRNDYFMDGCEGMTLECCVHFHDLVGHLPELNFEHILSFFRIMYLTKREQDVLTIHHNCWHSFYRIGVVSYLSSFGISKSEFGEFVIIPWIVFKRFLLHVDQQNYHATIDQIKKTCDPVLKYADSDVIGCDNLGVSEVHWKDKVIPVNGFSFC